MSLHWILVLGTFWIVCLSRVCPFTGYRGVLDTSHWYLSPDKWSRWWNETRYKNTQSWALGHKCSVGEYSEEKSLRKIKPLLATEKTNFLDFWTITEHKKGLACWIIGGFFENWGWSHLHLDHIAQGDPVGESARCVGGSERTFSPPCCAGKAPTLYFELTPDTDPLCSCRHCGHLTKTPDHLISSAWHHNVTWTHLARWEVHTLCGCLSL